MMTAMKRRVTCVTDPPNVVQCCCSTVMRSATVCLRRSKAIVVYAVLVPTRVHTRQTGFVTFCIDTMRSASVNCTGYNYPRQRRAHVNLNGVVEHLILVWHKPQMWVQSNCCL